MALLIIQTNSLGATRCWLTRRSSDTGNLEQDLPALLVAVAEAARERDTAVCLFIDEVQYLSAKELAAVVVGCHEIAQQGLPLLFIGAGLPQVAALAGNAKSQNACSPILKLARWTPKRHAARSLSQRADRAFITCRTPWTSCCGKATAIHISFRSGASLSGTPPCSRRCARTM